VYNNFYLFLNQISPRTKQQDKSLDSCGFKWRQTLSRV